MFYIILLMTATLDEEELLLVRETARGLLGAHTGGDRGGDRPEGAGTWRVLWSRLAEAGWAGIALPRGGGARGGGGGGLGATGLVALLEEAGRHVVPAPLLSTAGLFVPVVHAAGAGGSTAERALEPVVGHGRPAGLADGRRSRIGGHRPGGAVWDGRRLVAQRLVVADIDRIALLAVVAEDGDGAPVVAVVDTGGPGVDIVSSSKADPDRPLGVVDLEVTTDPDRVLHADPLRGLETATVAVAAELVGIAERCLELSIRHASDRTQFDRPIGSFQAIKHRLADNAVAVEGARSLVRAAALAIDAGSAATAGDRSSRVSMAKAAAGEAAAEAATSAVQVHGALAMSWEHPIHRYLRRAWQGSAALGGPAEHYELVAASLVGPGGLDHAGA